jgi:plastocyanin
MSKKNSMRRQYVIVCQLTVLLLLVNGCQRKSEPQNAASPIAPAYFKVDPSTAGVLQGKIHFAGKKPRFQPIDMSDEPACVEAHHGRPHDESEVVGPGGGLANVFIYVKAGLEGKTFEVPTTPVTIDQQGCWFSPRVLGIQVGQVLRVVNSDPVTHNIHPLAQINREWNHSQGQGDPPLARKFLHPEVMIPVKCNIHRWMHAYIGVVENPYFTVSSADGSFEISNLPPGDYVIEAWHEKLGTQEQRITISPSGKTTANFTFNGE